MKRSDLKVGEAYYHDRGQKWASGEGYQTGKAVVVTLDQQRNGGVLVDLTVEDWRGHEVTSRSIAALAHLRGLYEPIKAQVDAAVTARRERTAAREVEHQALVARKEAAQARAKEIGVDVLGVHNRGEHVSIGVGALERLLDAYDRLATRATKE